MEFKGTKGKWYWFKQDVSNLTDDEIYDLEQESGTYSLKYELPKLINQNDEVVCYFGNYEQYYPTEGTPPNEYDSLLISKAPEMFEMLKKCMLEFAMYKAEFGQGSQLEKEIMKLIKEASEL